MNHEQVAGTVPAGPGERIVIVGAGPTGLALAGELALAGVPCRVLERRARRTKDSRAFVLHARTMEMFALRGMAEEAVARCRPVGRVMMGTRGTEVDFDCLRSRFPYLTVLPQSVIEDILESRARRLGVEIIRDAEVVGLDQDGSGVTLSVSCDTEEWQERAAYAIGCDGADSVTRHLAGIPLEGATFQFAAVLADVRLGRPPGAEFTVHPGNDGLVISSRNGDGWHRVVCLDRSRPWTPERVTLEELGASLRRVTGHDLQPCESRWMGRFRLHERLAARYRHGRVLLAGDSAHLNSSLGGQGLNVGIQDAFNLGWKLAAVLNGWAQDGLLDSYEAERRPVADGVTRVTGHATSALTGSSLLWRVARHLTLGLLRVRPVQRLACEALAGISTHYPATRESGTLAGGRAPDLRLNLPDGRIARLFELMGDGRFGLVDLGAQGTAAAAVGAWSDRVRPLEAELDEPGRLRGARALLVRPDGYVAWSSATKDPAERAAECRRALTRWCGAERPGGTADPGADTRLGAVLDAMDASLPDPSGMGDVGLPGGDPPAPGGGPDAAP